MRETTRHDLVHLEVLRALRRVHGGAVAIGPKSGPALGVRQRAHPAERRRIEKAAVLMVRPGQMIFFNAGIITSALAEELAASTGLTVVTNA